jgi:hypothetical protein
MKERFLMKDCSLVGYYAMLTNGFITQYAVVTGNHYEFTYGGFGCMASYSFVENNQLVIHSVSNVESHGMFVRSDAYIANNNVSGAGGVPNDGETVSWEAPMGDGNFNWGTVVSASANSVTVTPKTTLTNPPLKQGGLCVQITDGRGLGQLQKVASISGNTITVAAPFAVVPDNTSKWTLITPMKGNTVYKNTGTDNGKGVLPFGNSYDVVITDNVLTNTSGVMVWAISGSAYGDTPAYFTRIARNTISGVSKYSHASAIGIIGTRQTSDGYYVDVVEYGAEIIDNFLSGDNTQTPAGQIEGGNFCGIFVQSYDAGHYNGIGVGDCTNTLIEGNYVSNQQTGITLTAADYGQVISRNTYDGKVLTFLVDSGGWGTSTNTLVVGNILGTFFSSSRHQQPNDGRRRGR